MPIPIKPVHSLDLHAELFDIPVVNQQGLSDLQMMLLGTETNKPKRQAGKLSNRDIDILQQIESDINSVKTASSEYRVPNHITDSDLLYLKTAGLLSGHGRSVNLTESAKLALRDFYLSAETTNEFRKSRTKQKFDLNEAKSVTASTSKFRRVASWLTSSKNSSLEFDIRFIANTDKLRAKGLMFADPLKDTEVAFFDFDYPDCYSFWNKNVDFPLSLAFLDSNKKVLDFKDLDKQSEKSVSPNSNKVVYVVEANKGVFDKLGIKIGDQFKISENKLILV